MARALINIPTSGNIGDVKASMLTLAQFQAINGVNWVLADGSSAAGTTYAAITGASNVPDMRGQFLRGKNNGRVDGNQDPSGERALGVLQADQMQGHGHAYYSNQNFNIGGNAGYARVPRQTGINADLQSADVVNTSNTPIREPTTNGSNGTPRTGNETRPRNVAVNYFIKVN